MGRHRAVYFDLDGTLVDVSRRFHRAWNVARLAEDLHVVDWEEFRHRQGHNHLTAEVHPERVGSFWKVFLEDFSHNPEPHPGEPFPGVSDLLEELAARRFVSAVITNRSCPAAMVHAELEEMGLSRHFRLVLSQGEFNFARGDFARDTKLYSKEAMIHHACRRLEITPDEVVFVGDLTTDVSSARKAGCALAVGVLSGGIERETLESAGAHHVLDSVTDVLELLEHL